MWFAIQKQKIDDRTELDLTKELEFLTEITYGLPKEFYTKREWAQYTCEKMRLAHLLNKIRES